MNTIIFDGKKFAGEKEKILKEKIKNLKLKLTLVSILVGTNKASVIYTNLKQKAARRVGIKFIIKKFPANIEPEKIISEIKKYNENDKVQGIMVQLPLPESLKAKETKIINSIAKTKDVDGLTKNSHFMQATVRAILEILDYATKDMPYIGKKATVIGAKGRVGKGVVEMLDKKNYKVCECDKDTRDLYAKLTNVDLVISATGTPGLIKGEVVKEGCIAIDVGAPLGDFEKGVADRAGFFTPVPGGVGPVTIICLLENLVEATV